MSAPNGDEDGLPQTGNIVTTVLLQEDVLHEPFLARELIRLSHGPRDVIAIQAFKGASLNCAFFAQNALGV